MRDDIEHLPLSQAAKAYARRRGLKSMKAQPWPWLKVMGELTNPPGSGRPVKGFKSTDAAGPVPRAFESRKFRAQKLVEDLLRGR